MLLYCNISPFFSSLSKVACIAWFLFALLVFYHPYQHLSRTASIFYLILLLRVLLFYILLSKYPLSQNGTSKFHYERVIKLMESKNDMYPQSDFKCGENNSIKYYADGYRKMEREKKKKPKWNQCTKYNRLAYFTVSFGICVCVNRSDINLILYIE